MKTLITLLLSFFIYQSSIACSCMSSGNSLCESFRNDTFVKLVILCRKIDTVAYGFRVQRLHNIFGIETRDTLTIWGDNGALCRSYDYWKIGDSIILSLQNCDTVGNMVINPDYPPVTELLTDYQVSGCGAYAADVADGKVKGYIDKAQMQSFELSAFIQANCFKRDAPTDTDKDDMEPPFELLTQLNSIQLKIATPGNHTFGLYDATGRCLQTTGLLQGINNIDTDKLSAGAYIVAITIGSRRYTQKFVLAR